jgi:hypothetical protein
VLLTEQAAAAASVSVDVGGSFRRRRSKRGRLWFRHFVVVSVAIIRKVQLPKGFGRHRHTRDHRRGRTPAVVLLLFFTVRNRNSNRDRGSSSS